MSVVIILIGFSLVVALIFLGAYIWAVKSGQYDDNYTPSVRILFEDKYVEKKDDKNTDTENKKDNHRINE